MLGEIGVPDFSNANGNLEEIIRKLGSDYVGDKTIKGIIVQAKKKGIGYTTKIMKVISKNLDYYPMSSLRVFLKTEDLDIEKPTNEIALEILEEHELLAPKELGIRYIRVYRDGVWDLEPDSYLEKIILEHCIVNSYFDELSDAQQASRINMIKRFIRSNVLCSIMDFDANPYLINVLNGVIDISKIPFKFLKHDPEYKLIRQFPIIYSPKTHCPEIMKFVREIFHKEDIFLMYQWCGLCLTTFMNFQKGMLLYGEGSNGKDTFINLLMYLLGRSNVSSVDLFDLDNSFLYCETEGKTLNAVAETETNKKINIRKAKAHIGNTKKMLINRKNLAPYDIIPTCKMMYAVNDHFPKLPEDVNKGFFRKWFIVECPNNFDKNPDNQLFDKLTTDRELTGFLNVCLMGLARLLKKNRFTNNCKAKTYWEDIKDAWLSKINFFSIFIEECCIVGKYETAMINKNNDFWEQKEDVHNAYNEFRKVKGKPTVSPKALTIQVKTNGFGVTKRRIDNAQKPIYTGFKLKNKTIIKETKKGLNKLLEEAKEVIHGKKEEEDDDFFEVDDI